MGQPGGGQSGGGLPGACQPGRGRPNRGLPEACQPGESQPDRGQPVRGQPERDQPGRGQPGERHYSVYDRALVGENTMISSDFCSALGEILTVLGRVDDSTRESLVQTLVNMGSLPEIRAEDNYPKEEIREKIIAVLRESGEALPGPELWKRCGCWNHQLRMMFLHQAKILVEEGLLSKPKGNFRLRSDTEVESGPDCSA